MPQLALPRGRDADHRGGHRKERVFTNSGLVKAVALIHGSVGGLWSIVAEKQHATLRIEPFAPLASADRLGLEAEGARMLAFAAPGKEKHEVRLVE